jgi:hypothetical protein
MINDCCIRCYAQLITESVLEGTRGAKMKGKRLQSKTESPRIHRGNRGFALPIMMCTILLLLVIGLGLLCFGQNSRRFAVDTSSGIVARCAADAGVTQALYEMNKKIKVLPWNNGNLPMLKGELLPNTDATYTFKVSGDLSSGHYVKSTLLFPAAGAF